jgi:hypothetical protein
VTPILSPFFAFDSSRGASIFWHAGEISTTNICPQSQFREKRRLLPYPLRPETALQGVLGGPVRAKTCHPTISSPRIRICPKPIRVHPARAVAHSGHQNDLWARRIWRPAKKVPLFVKTPEIVTTFHSPYT